MAGRPPLRIGQHGKITRVQIESGVWIARCRYRDTDGVTRIVERKSPTTDQHGKKAEDALLEALANRQAPGDGAITIATKLTTLIDTHIERNKDTWADRTFDTYTYTAKLFGKLIGGLRVGDCTPPRIDAALRSMNTAHGPGETRRAKVLTRAALQLAVMAGTLPTNPVRDVENQGKAKKAKGAKALDRKQLDDMLAKLSASEYCRHKDLVDPIIMLAATGVRRSELLGLRWSDYDPVAGTITVSGKLIRKTGEGLKRKDETKTEAGARTIPLPLFAREMLARRKRTAYYGEQKMIFPSTAGTWRDPDNFNADWREARDALGVPEITSHSFRKTMATLIDEEGMSARVGADHLGHSRVSMTQDVYMARGRTHAQVADMLDRIVTVPQ